MRARANNGNWYLADSVFKVGRLDESFVEASARDDCVFEALSLILLDVLRSFPLHAVTEPALSIVNKKSNSGTTDDINVVINFNPLIVIFYEP